MLLCVTEDNNKTVLSATMSQEEALASPRRFVYENGLWWYWNHEDEHGQPVGIVELARTKKAGLGTFTFRKTLVQDALWVDGFSLLGDYELETSLLRRRLREVTVCKVCRGLVQDCGSKSRNCSGLIGITPASRSVGEA